jgi:chitinase
VGVSGTLNFSPGVTTKVVRVDLLDCGNSGFNSFTLDLSSPVNATITRASARVGIVGDGNQTTTPGLYVRDAVVDNRSGSIDVPVLLGGPAGSASNSTVTVDYATHNGSAVAGTDYGSTSGTLTFGPGETAKNVVVPITDRSGAAPSRSFSVSLSSPTNATIVDGTGVVTIGASGGTAVASPGISAPPDVVVGEADGYVDLPVTLSAPGTSVVSVAYTTTNSTAVSSTGCPYNYVGVSGTLNFSPGVTTKVVRVDLLDCNVADPGYFTLNLSAPVNATITRASTRITIAETPGRPGAPTGVTAASGNQTAVVTFSPPASDGGNPINSYTVTASPGGAKASSVSSPIKVAGLTNGTAYTFTVTATNDVGTGPASAASNTVIPSTVPAAPTAVRAVSGSTTTATGSLIVTFTLGADNGSAITSQTAKCTSSNGGATETGTHSGASAGAITVASVTTGKTYTCTVTATNARGASLASAPSLPVTVGAS